MAFSLYAFGVGEAREALAKGEKFKPRFFEMTLISVGVAVVSFFVGILAKKFLGVDL